MILTVQSQFWKAFLLFINSELPAGRIYFLKSSFLDGSGIQNSKKYNLNILTEKAVLAESERDEILKTRWQYHTTFIPLRDSYH